MGKDKEVSELRSMSLGDHLEELRSRLILIITGVFAGLIVCLFFGRFLVDILTIPFAKALGSPDVMSELDYPAGGRVFGIY